MSRCQGYIVVVDEATPGGADPSCVMVMERGTLTFWPPIYGRFPLARALTRLALKGVPPWRITIIREVG